MVVEHRASSCKSLTANHRSEKMKARSLVVLIIAIVTTAGAAGLLVVSRAPALAPWTLDPRRPSVTLEDVEQEVIRRHPVPDIIGSKLSEQIATGRVLLFDVRTKEEFDMGHLKGAIQVDPGEATDAFIAKYGSNMQDHSVVFYCSVGLRSSQFLQRVRPLLSPSVRGSAFNLRGGAFRWVSEGRELVSAGGVARLHPFDDSWAKLLARTLPQ